MLKWLDENLEEFLMVALLIAMTVIMGIQVFARYALGASLSWSEELTRYLFIWSGFISVSYCTKKCISIKIEQFVAMFPRRGKALFKVVNHTIELALFLKKNHIRPEQVQDFYPTPGTISTCMFYTELDPYTMESVYVAKSEHDKALQRALLQYFNPKNQRLVEEALRKAKRYDLIGYDNKCLIKPAKPSHSVNQNGRNQNRNFNKSKKYSMSGKGKRK